MALLIPVLLVVALTRAWWLLIITALLGVLRGLGLRGWALGAAGILLWLGAAGVKWRWPDSFPAGLIAWRVETMLITLTLLVLAVLFAWLLRYLHGRSAAAIPSGPGLTPVRGAAQAAIAPPDVTPPDDALTRYARHIVLRELGGPGQSKLRKAHVLVVGAGGLGAPVCLYLAAAGVGRITLADDDRVSISNLQRQVIFRSRDDGRLKAEAAAEAMHALNPHVEITPLLRRITEGDADLLRQFDLVLDGTDSFAARAAVNKAAVLAQVPLIAGAMSQWEGQVTIWDSAHAAPCYACIFPTAPAAGLAPSCAEAGVVGPLPGIIGSTMALEAIKLIAGAGQPLRGRMLIFDGLWGETRTIALHPRADCAVCGGSGHSASG